MPQIAPTDETTIANRALSLIKSSYRLESIDDDAGHKADVVRLHFAPTRDEGLRARAWNFAETYAQLGASTDVPKFGFAYYYDLPADCLAVRQVVGTTADNWKVQGRRLMTDLAAPIDVIYTRRITEPVYWDSLFTKAFVRALAGALAPELCSDDVIRKNIIEEARDAFSAALPVDSAEGTPDEIPDPEIITTRF